MKYYKILSWLLFALALVVFGRTIYGFYETVTACISSCNFCNNCNGPRNFGTVINYGLIDIILWGLWVGFILWIKKHH